MIGDLDHAYIGTKLRGMTQIDNDLLISARFSYPHGQCPGVGVGGFLLGGGVNWLGTFNKYGYG